MKLVGKYKNIILLFFGLGDEEQSCFLFVALIGVLKPSLSTGAVSKFNLRRASVFRCDPGPEAEVITYVEVVLRPEEELPTTELGVM